MRKVAVRKSSVHGKGLFAARRIPQGQRIGRLTGTPTRRDGRHVLWIVEPDGSERGFRGTNAIRYANHSLRPNSRFDGRDLYAIRDIAVDEEITVHYGEDWERCP